LKYFIRHLTPAFHKGGHIARMMGVLAATTNEVVATALAVSTIPNGGKGRQRTNDRRHDCYPQDDWRHT
jgi:hypothetical protein